MKLLKIVVAISSIMVIASSAFGACAHKPKDGIYSTTTSSMLAGRASEAFCTGVGSGVTGNTENAMSWDGAVLGGQWRIWDMAIDGAGAVETGNFFDSFGNGWKDYVTNYTGGQFWLSGTHTWGDGYGDFTGTITYYNVGARVAYVGWQPVGVTSYTNMRGAFDSCAFSVINYCISTAILVWQTGYTTPMPVNYPPFLCSANGGELYDVCCAELSIITVCCDPTATQQSSWGTIKGLFR